MTSNENGSFSSKHSIQKIVWQNSSLFDESKIESLIRIQNGWKADRKTANPATGFLATVFNKSEVIEYLKAGSAYYLFFCENEIQGFALTTPIKYFTNQFKGRNGCAFVPSRAIDFDKTTYLYQLVVKRGIARSGIGTALIEAIMQEDPHSLLLGDVLSKPIENIPSIKFFDSKGFDRVGELTMNNYRDFGALTSIVFLGSWDSIQIKK